LLDDVPFGLAGGLAKLEDLGPIHVAFTHDRAGLAAVLLEIGFSLAARSVKNLAVSTKACAEAKQP